MKGEYARVYDYQMELLRTNPGSTVVVTLDPEIKDRKVFEGFYVCFDACKKGFIAGCRKVVGLDGCWFKGAHNGNLLCAIERDANNQMYHVAWAAVPKKAMILGTGSLVSSRKTLTSTMVVKIGLSYLISRRYK
jgi:hypothetical protein